MYAKNSRFKHSGKTEIIVGAVVETMGTIKVAMKGSDVKEGIRYLIILHEASFWRKFDILNSTYHENNTNIESNGYIDNLWKKTEKIEKKNSNWTIYQRVMSKRIQSLIHLTDFRLNIINFQLGELSPKHNKFFVLCVWWN